MLRSGDQRVMLLVVQAESQQSLNWLMPMLVVAGWLGFAFLVVVFVRDRIARRQHNRPTPRDMINAAKQQSSRQEASHDVAEAAAVQSAQRMASLIDTKAARVEQLLDQADARIARLQALLDKSDDSTTVVRDREDSAQTGGSGGRGGSGGSTSSPSVATIAIRDDRASAEPPSSAAAAPGARDVNEEADASAGSSNEEASAPVRPLASSVIELADEGLTPVEIAQQLDEQIGKVELILALRSHEPR